MSKDRAKYWREYRAKNRDRILAQERERRKNESPERRAYRLALKRANAHKHYKHKARPQFMKNLSADELKAHLYARRHDWYMRNKERILEQQKMYRLANPHPKPHPTRTRQTHEEVLAKKRERYYRWRENNYQAALEYEREHHLKYRRRKGEYKPLFSMRIPDWVTCPAEARHLRLEAEAYKRSITIDFITAIQSGLSIKNSKWQPKRR